MENTHFLIPWICFTAVSNTYQLMNHIQQRATNFVTRTYLQTGHRRY